MHIDSVAVCVFDRSILPLCDDIYIANGHQVLSFGGDWWCYWLKVSRVQYFYAPTASLHMLPCVPGSLNWTKSDSLKSSEKLKPTKQKHVLLQAPPTSSKRFHLTLDFSPAPQKDPQTSFAERISGAHSHCTWCINEKFAGDSRRVAFFPVENDSDWSISRRLQIRPCSCSDLRNSGCSSQSQLQFAGKTSGSKHNNRLNWLQEYWDQ